MRLAMVSVAVIAVSGTATGEEGLQAKLKEAQKACLKAEDALKIAVNEYADAEVELVKAMRPEDKKHHETLVKKHLKRLEAHVEALMQYKKAVEERGPLLVRVTSLREEGRPDKSLEARLEAVQTRCTEAKKKAAAERAQADGVGRELKDFEKKAEKHVPRALIERRDRLYGKIADRQKDWEKAVRGRVDLEMQIEFPERGRP